MMANLILKMPKAFNPIKHIGNLSKAYQRNIIKSYMRSDYCNKRLFTTVTSRGQLSGLFQNGPTTAASLTINSQSRTKKFDATRRETTIPLYPAHSEERSKQTSRKLSTCAPPLLDPRGRVAVVTGGSRGIGLSMVEELLCNGAKVFIIDMEKDIGECAAVRLASIYGWDNIQFACGDVTCFESFEACVHLAVCKFQGLDIFINNAGVLTSNPRDKIIDINYKSLVFGTRLGIKYMGSDQGKYGGVVINVASIVGLIGLPGTPVYSATKHAVIGLTMSYGDNLTFDKTCVRVCAVCPGVTTTAMTTATEDIPLEHFREGAGERTLLKEQFRSLPSQPSARLGPATVHVIRYGPNGSLWVTEDNELYQVIIPDYHDVECCNSRIKQLDC